MARAKLTNNAITVLASDITNVATSMTVAAGKGALFPEPGTNYFYCTLTEGALMEIVQVTARTADVFTILRGRDGTTGQAFTSAAAVRVNLTAAVMAELATLTHTETLTNKTMTTPAINGYTEGTVTANTGTAYSIDISTGTVQILTLTGNCTYTFPTGTTGKSFLLIQKQDATGGRTVTWPGIVRWPFNVAPTLTATANKADVFAFTCESGNWFARAVGYQYL